MLRFRRQISPVRRTYPVKPLFTFGYDPAVVSEATRTCHDMHVFAVDNGDFNVAIKRHGVYRLPLHEGIICGRLRGVIDLNQSLEAAWMRG